VRPSRHGTRDADPPLPRVAAPLGSIPPLSAALGVAPLDSNRPPPGRTGRTGAQVGVHKQATHRPGPRAVPGSTGAERAGFVQIGSDVTEASAGLSWGGEFDKRNLAMSADGTVLAAGAPWSDAAAANAGEVRVFELVGGSWQPRGAPIYGSAQDNAGMSVALSADGNTLAIGFPGADPSGLSDAGEVRVYAWDSSTWAPVGSPIAGLAAGDLFGLSLSLNADATVVAVGDDPNPGQVRVFELVSGSWQPRGGPLQDPNGQELSEWCGVSLSADGNTLAIGFPGADPPGLSNAGEVRVYAWDSTTWAPVGSAMPGTLAAGNFGVSVSLSADGTVVAFGSRADPLGDLTRIGEIRVFEFVGGAWVPKGASLEGTISAGIGYNVFLSSDGTTLASVAQTKIAGAPDAVRSGVHVWKWSDAVEEWEPRGSLKSIIGSMALSGDGTAIAAGVTGGIQYVAAAPAVRVFRPTLAGQEREWGRPGAAPHAPRRPAPHDRALGGAGALWPGSSGGADA